MMGSRGQPTADSTRSVPLDASSPKAEQYAFPLPTLDPAEFRWHPSPKNNSILQRKANGVEALVGIKDANAVGTYDLYNNIVLRVGDISDLTLPRLKRAFVRAMLDARFENPSIACYGVWGQNKEPHLPHIQYRPFKSHNEARTWAYNSIYVRATSLTSSELRAERIEKRRAEAIPKSSNSLDVVISADVAHERTILEPGTKLDLMFLFNHLSWDGKARSFTSELVCRATQILEKGLENTVPAYRWGEEKARLDPPILDVMLVGMETLGEDYKAVHRRLLESQMQVGVRMQSLFSCAKADRRILHLAADINNFQSTIVELGSTSYQPPRRSASASLLHERRGRQKNFKRCQIQTRPKIQHWPSRPCRYSSGIVEAPSDPRICRRHGIPLLPITRRWARVSFGRPYYPTIWQCAGLCRRGVPEASKLGHQERRS